MNTTPSRLDGRVAVVTGAGGAIGRAIVLRLAVEGADVVAAARDMKAAAETAAAARALGARCECLRVDITAQTDLDAVVPFARETFSRIPDVLVCCAGAQTFGDIFDLSMEEWDAVFDVNARGTFMTMRTLAREMRNVGGGAIVTVASLQGRLGNPWFAHYAASKAAMLSLTRSFALALAPQRVRVNAVAPGIIDAGLGEKADHELARLRGLPHGEPTRQRVAQVPLGRAGTPQDCAAAVAFLASDDAAYITGECIHVCGGDLML
jgi:NAD(P)-dependent dehydrogenase (short-subunit alcohol dehydrogenase family)